MNERNIRYVINYMLEKGKADIGWDGDITLYDIKSFNKDDFHVHVNISYYETNNSFKNKNQTKGFIIPIEFFNKTLREYKLNKLLYE